MFLYVNLGCFFWMGTEGNRLGQKEILSSQVNNEGVCSSLCYLILWYGILFCVIIIRYVMLCCIVVFSIVSFDKICSNVILFDVTDSLLGNMIFYYIICYSYVMSNYIVLCYVMSWY